MGYEDPCANDPAHGKAMVGISNPSGEPDGYWVCQACFEKYLIGSRELADNLAAFLNGEPPDQPRRRDERGT